jgi:hypothetical protein
VSVARKLLEIMPTLKVVIVRIPSLSGHLTG